MVIYFWPSVEEGLQKLHLCLHHTELVWPLQAPRNGWNGLLSCMQKQDSYRGRHLQEPRAEESKTWVWRWELVPSFMCTVCSSLKNCSILVSATSPLRNRWKSPLNLNLHQFFISETQPFPCPSQRWPEKESNILPHPCSLLALYLAWQYYASCSHDCSSY